MFCLSLWKISDVWFPLLTRCDIYWLNAINSTFKMSNSQIAIPATEKMDPFDFNELMTFSLNFTF